MVGILHTSLPGYENRPMLEAISVARGYGLNAILFDNMLDVFPGLDPTELDGITAEGLRQGVEIATSIGFFNPVHPVRCGALLEAGDGDIGKGLLAAVDAAKRLGSKTLFFMIGKIEDRDLGPDRWLAQLEGVAGALKALKPQLRDSGVQLLLKTHEEMSTQEGLHVIEDVGGDILGIALDPVNLLCRIEDPVAAAQRVANHIRQVHLDDAFVTFDGDSVRRYLAPMGKGELAWPKLLELTPDAAIWIEFHRGQFAMPVFDPVWLAAQPNLILDEYRASLRNAFRNHQSDRTTVDQFDPCGRLMPALEWLRAQA